MQWGIFSLTPRRPADGDRWIERLRSVAPALIVIATFAMLAAPGASASTLPQAAEQLLGWHLQPPPLFPAQLPTQFDGAQVTLSRSMGIDFTAQFATANCTGTSFCVTLQRSGYATLDSIVNDPDVFDVKTMQIGSRNVYAGNSGHSAIPSFVIWHEQGHTYLVAERYAYLDTSLPTLAALVQSLRTLAAPPPPACHPLVFISARGSGETSTGTSDMAASPITARVYQEMRRQLKQGTPAPAFYQLPYPALSVAVIGAGLKTGSVKARINRAMKNLQTYISGEKLGVSNLSSYVNATEQACPGTKFALAGYSQGAMVIHDYLTMLAESSHPSPARVALRGEVLVGDPERVAKSRVTNFGSAPLGDTGICRAAENKFKLLICTPGATTMDVPSFAQNVWQVCDASDIVCDFSALLHLNTRQGLSNEVKAGEATHKYCVTGKRGIRCSQALIAAGQALGKHL